MDRLSVLISEYQTLDRQRDRTRMREVFAEAAALIDRAKAPEKWAAMRSAYADLSEADDPDGAIAAYRDALQIWSPDQDRDAWAHCHGSLGLLLARAVQPGSEHAEQAITHLELAVGDQPVFASALALLYRIRVRGDPAENWRKRVTYLTAALNRVSREADPIRWAAAENELGVAVGEEPNADFSRAIDERIQHHEQALAVLGERHDQIWIDTCLQLSECYVGRVLGDLRENRRKGEDFARRGLAACEDTQHADLQRQALLTLARVLAHQEGDQRIAGLGEALSLCDRARRLIDVEARPELAANVDSLRANVCLELLRLGHTEWLDEFKAACGRAARGFETRSHPVERRRVCHMHGEGLLEAGEFGPAAECFDAALHVGETLLAQATSTSGRMERIWELADSSALLSYCCLKLGRIDRALEALEKGKTRLWSARTEQGPLDLAAMVPQGGALLFPVFAFREGAVVIVTRSGDSVRHEVVWLPRFGKQRVMSLQRGERWETELGGWLYAYSCRNSQPEQWRRQIDDIGAVLYAEVWSPVLARLGELGVLPGAELVWFPQGGCGVFPMHAAWTTRAGTRRWIIEEHAIRYAPSLRVLSREPRASGSMLIVADPTGDLDFSILESALVERHVASAGLQVLIGDAASPRAVLDAVQGCGLAHFACHAAFNLEDPLQSRVLLARGEALTLNEWISRPGGRVPAFIVLSACETAMARVTATADEFLGFPAALLSGGAATVIATLWPVEDPATALLMWRFYEVRASQQTTAAEALRQAQEWLRTVTCRELAERLAALRTAPAPLGKLAAGLQAELSHEDPNGCPYAAPFYWAAFTVSGA